MCSAWKAVNSFRNIRNEDVEYTTIGDTSVKEDIQNRLRKKWTQVLETGTYRRTERNADALSQANPPQQENNSSADSPFIWTEDWFMGKLHHTLRLFVLTFGGPVEMPNEAPAGQSFSHLAWRFKFPQCSNLEINRRN
jgi:hypothetical protein